MNGNSGIIVNGGSVTADVLAVGNRAKASMSVSKAADRLQAEGQSDIKLKLQQLLSALDVNSESLKDPDGTFEMTHRIASELSKSKPDKITVKSLITQIVEETKSIAEIASAAVAFKDVIGNLF